MINYIAVILAGEYRTWPKVCSYMFNYFSRHARKVDYFFVTWNTSEKELVNEQDLKVTFKHENLVDYKLLSPKIFTSTFFRQHYLMKVGNMLKNEYEFSHNFIYDQVVVTRPDLYFRSNINHKWVYCPDYYFHTNPGPYYSVDNPYAWVQDTYIRSNSATNDIICQRYFEGYNDFTKQISHQPWMSGFMGHHELAARFLMVRGLLPIDGELTHDGKLLNRNADFTFSCIIRSKCKLDNINLDRFSMTELLEFIHSNNG